MTALQAALELGISSGLVRRHCRKGQIKAEMHGRDWWIEDEEVARFKAAPHPTPGRPAKAKTQE